MNTALITGANRGLGLALATRYLARPDTQVIAIARDLAQSPELHALASAHDGRVRAIQTDVANGASIDALGKELGDVSIDLLVNNAGVPSRAGFGDITAAELAKVFAVNAFAPLLVTQALRTKLARGGKVVNITSVLGSIASSSGDDYLTYGMSKAALNMFPVKLAAALRADEIAVLALHPGWVQTRMGGSGAAISVDTSADGMMRVIDALSMATTGSYLAYDGGAIEW